MLQGDPDNEQATKNRIKKKLQLLNKIKKMEGILNAAEDFIDESLAASEEAQKVDKIRKKLNKK